jgi:hypothetical protein
MVWAEPDLLQAIEVMREVAQKRHTSPTTDPEVITEYRRRFSAKTVGAHYRQRLAELWDSRSQIQARIDRQIKDYQDEYTSNAAQCVSPWRRNQW